MHVLMICDQFPALTTEKISKNLQSKTLLLLRKVALINSDFAMCDPQPQNLAVSHYTLISNDEPSSCNIIGQNGICINVACALDLNRNWKF